MDGDVIYIPLSRKIHRKILVATKGTFDPYYNADEAALKYCAAVIQGGNCKYDEDYIIENSSDLGDLADEMPSTQYDLPLVWKEITVPEHSHVRMKYNGLAFEAIV